MPGPHLSRSHANEPSAPSAPALLTRAVAAAGFLAVSGITFPFIAVLRHNQDHFQISLAGHSGSLGILTATCFVSLIAIQLIVPRQHARATTLAIFALGAVAWLNSVVLVGDFGFFDGSAIEWQSHRLQLLLEFLLGGASIAAIVRCRRWTYEQLPFLSILLGVLAAVPALLPAGTTSADAQDYVFTDDGVLQLSKDRNAFLIVVDTMQSDVFAGIVEKNPELAKKLRGFTYFRNALSTFPKTYASVPAMLTGRAFGNEQPVRDYLRSAYFSGSLPQVLSEAGYDVRMLPYRVQPLIADPALTRNVAKASSREEVEPTTATEFVQLLDMVLFRLVPTPLKPWIYNDGEFRLARLHRPAAGGQDCEVTPQYSRGNDHHDLKFLDSFISCSRRAYDAPAFRFYHLSGAHQPFVLDANLNHLDAAQRNRDSFVAHSEGALAVLLRLFRQLRELGAYDDSLIVIAGDHGGGELRVGVDPSAAASVSIEGSYEAELSPHVATEDLIAGAIPLVLIKPPGASHEFRISDAPVELTDVPTTVVKELGLGETDGQSMFDIDENAERSRLHRYYRFAGWNVDYILPLVEFRVEGHSWDPASWAATGKDLNPVNNRTPGNYATLFEGGMPSQYLRRGWQEPTTEGTRMAEPEATLHLAGGFQPNGAPLGLAVIHKPLRSTDADGVLLDVEVNGEHEDSLTILPGSRRVDGLISRRNAQQSPMKITFRADQSAAARELIFHEVTVEPLSVPEYRVGSVIDFTAGGNSEPYQVAGFSHQERWGTWSHGDRSVLVLGLDDAGDSALEARIDAAGLVTQENPKQRVIVIANGSILTEVTLSVREFQQFTFRIPPRVAADQFLRLEFKFPDAISPHSLGRSNDTRLLAMGFIRMIISKADS